MNILFTHSYFYRFDNKQWKAQQPYPPYGTIYAAALMRAHNYNVDLFDTNLRKNILDLAPVIEKKQPKYLVIYDDGFNYLTKMCLTKMREAALEMCKIGKEHHCIVIVCSSDSTDHYEKYLAAGADFVLHGEGEMTLLELTNTIEQNNNAFENILGISYKKENKTIKNPGRPVLRELDDLPNPAWDLIDIATYKDIWIRNHGYFSLNIATTRGCPYKCNWCAKPIYGSRYNSRSPQRVVQEIAMMVRDFGVNHLWVCDDIFGLKPGWVQQFRDLLKEQNITIKYKIQSRADLMLESQQIDALVESGLQQVWIGAESGSQAILDAMDKGTTISQIQDATQLLKSKGVEVCFFLQFGYLGETKEDINKTIKMVEELLPYDIGISVSYPLPGTKFFDKVKNQLREKQNWADSDDLDMMYSGTYKPAYYKRLHRFVHKVFRRAQGIENLKKIIQNPTTLSYQKLRSALAIAYYIPAAIIEKRKLSKLEN